MSVSALVLILACLPFSGWSEAGSSQESPKPPELVDRLFATLKSQEKPFTLVTRIYLKPGTQKEFEEIAVRVGLASTADSCCLGYEFHRDLEKPTNYTGN